MLEERSALVPSAVSFISYPRGYEDRCAAALHEALGSVPAYASWRGYDPGESEPCIVRLAQMPLLRKADLRRVGPHGLVPGARSIEEALARGEISLVTTSGSTGDRVLNVWHQGWWDASERASWSLNRYASGLGSHPEAILASPHCVGVPCEDGYLSLEARRLERFLYLSERSDPSAWTAHHMDRMIDEINLFRPVVLEANPSFLARLARHALERGRSIVRPKLVVFTYENPSILHYRIVRSVLGAPIASSYGSTEAGYVFMECEAGRLHQNTETCHVDFLPCVSMHGGQGVGRIAVTIFGHPWRSLLRFDPGDLVRLDGETACPCGRSEGLVALSVEGRTDALTLSRDGRAVTQGEVDRALARVDGLLEYQVVQTGRADLLVRYLAQPEAGDAAARRLREVLRELYGADVTVRAQEVDGIRPDPPGKYRLARALFPIDADGLLDRSFLPQGAAPARGGRTPRGACDPQGAPRSMQARPESGPGRD